MAADPTARQELVCCDSCRTNVIPSTVERTSISGMEVVMCRDARACRRRAEAAGIWKAPR